MRAYKSRAQIQRKIQRAQRRTKSVETAQEGTVLIGAWGITEDENGSLVIHNTNTGERVVLGGFPQ